MFTATVAPESLNCGGESRTTTAKVFTLGTEGQVQTRRRLRNALRAGRGGIVSVKGHSTKRLDC